MTTTDPGAPTIERVRHIQANRGLGDDHVVWVGPTGFVMAHTDEERATIDLCRCPLHTWLMERGGPPEVKEVPGFYHVIEIPVDGYSTSYRGDGGRWEWEWMMV